MNGRKRTRRMKPPPDSMALTISEMSEDFRISRNRIFSEMKAGRLAAKRVGQRVLIAREDANNWWASLPNRGAA